MVIKALPWAPSALTGCVSCICLSLFLGDRLCTVAFITAKAGRGGCVTVQRPERRAVCSGGLIWRFPMMRLLT